ncbi:hypothetical protein D3C71_1699150 [compost metagenome]
MFQRRRKLLGLGGQHFQISLLHPPPSPEVHTRIARHTSQIRTGMLVVIEHTGFGQQPHEHILGQFRRIMGIAELALEPLANPAMVGTVEFLQVETRGWSTGRGIHGAGHYANRNYSQW